MTSLTRNLPWFIRDLGVSIVGQECYASLVENLNFGDVECLKYSLSKGLGIAIVAGGTVMKVPQILLILNAQSAQGLSFPAYVLETLSYAITLVYSYRNEFPFSTYGENFFLTLQNAVITLLIIAYTPAQRGATQKIVLFAAASIATAFTLNTLPTSTLSLLQITTLPLSLSSKLPQIFQNKRDQSTGQLSAVAVIAQVAGCAARLFTTATEVGDPLVASGFVMALLLNIILGAQMWMYWGKASVSVMKTKTAVNGYPRERTEKARVSPTPEPAYYNAPKTPAVLRISTPPPRTPPSSIGRKWARKVD